MITINSCLKCKWEWPSRLERKAIKCPGCSSRNWSEPLKPKVYQVETLEIENRKLYPWYELEVNESVKWIAPLLEMNKWGDPQDINQMAVGRARRALSAFNRRSGRYHTWEAKYGYFVITRIT